MGAAPLISPSPTTLGSMISSTGEDIDDDDSDDSSSSTKTINLIRSPMEPTNRLESLFASLSPRSLDSFPQLNSTTGLTDPIDGIFDMLRVLGSSVPGNTPKSNTQLRQKGWSVLHVCASEGKLAQVKALINRGANLDALEADKWTPMMLAAQNGHLDVVRELVDRGAKINQVADDGVTALRQAAQNGHHEIVELLLMEKADPNICNPRGVGPLHATVARIGQPSEGKSRQTYTRIARALIRANADVNATDKDGDTALHLACSVGNLEIVQIVASRSNINTLNNAGRTPLSHAAYESRPDIVRFLIDHGADVSAINGQRQWTPLHYCSQFLTERTLETIKILVENGADINSRTDNNATALHIAAQKGDVHVIGYLIDHGALVDARTDGGRNPLFQATATGHVEAVRLLAEAGADVNVMETDALKFRPLHIAVMKKDLKMVQTLLSLQAEPNVQCGLENLTPLGLSAMLDAGDDIFMLLLEHGAQVD